MNRRSATLIAAGMALTVIVAAAAIALGVTGPTSQASADPAPAAGVDPSPRVKTITRTIEVQKGDPAGTSVVTVQGSAPATSIIAAPETDDSDDGWNDDDDDATSDDDHEDVDDHDDD